MKDRMNEGLSVSIHHTSFVIHHFFIMPAVEIYADKESLTRAAAEHFVRLAAESVAARDRFTVALSGGSTPLPVYSLLAEDAFSSRVDWTRVQVFWGDERCVAPDDPRSNYLAARTTLLERVSVPPENVHRIRGEEEPERAARLYARELQTMFGGDAERGGPPPAGFDLLLLGMGDDGHTASIFPNTPAATEQKRWVMSQYVAAVSMWRVTLTPPFINAACNVAFLVSGADKAERLRQVLEGPPQPPHVLPAQAIKPTSGQLLWLLDEAAAARLKNTVKAD